MNRIIKLSAFTLGVILCMSFTQAPSESDFTLQGLLKLMTQTEDFEEASTSGLEFLFEDGYETEDFESIRYVYGRGVKQGEEGPDGYKIIPTSLHAIYFTYRLDTSRNASLYFASENDAEQFIQDVLSQDSEQYGGKTYLVHPKDTEDGQYIYIDRVYDDGDGSTTEFVIYPPRLEDGFIRIELEVYS